jgi:hypothetical protein
MITRQIEGGVEKKHTKDDNGILRQDKKKKETEKNGKKFKKKQNCLPKIGLRPGTCPATYFRLDNLVCCIVIRFLLAIDYREREKQGDKAANSVYRSVGTNTLSRKTTMRSAGRTGLTLWRFCCVSVIERT